MMKSAGIDWFMVAKGIAAFCLAWGVVIVIAYFGLRKAVHRQVDEPGMYGIIGRMGSGKTYLMALMAYRAMRTEVWLKCDACLALGMDDAPRVCEDRVRGFRPVYCNFWCEGARPISGWNDLCTPDLPFGSRYDQTAGPLIMVDEMQLWWPSRAFRAPIEVHQLCSHLRKGRRTLLWCSQHESHVAKRLLQLSAGMWRAIQRHGIHYFTLYETDDFGRKDAKWQAKLRYKRDSEVQDSYDTEEVIHPACDWDATPKAAAVGGV